MKTLLSVILAVVWFLASTQDSKAVVLDFNGVPNFGGFCSTASVAEKGFQIGNCPEWFVEPGTIHLDDSGTGYQGLVSFSGPIFDALSVSIRALGFEFLDQTTFEVVPYDNVVFRGFRDGDLVAEQSHSTALFDFFEIHTVQFNSDFSDLDVLNIEQVLPSADVLAANPNAFCIDAPCAHVDLMSIELAPIPLPSSALALLAGMAGLGAVGLMRRRRTRAIAA